VEAGGQGGGPIGTETISNPLAGSAVRFGAAVAMADLDADGIEELIVGAPGAYVPTGAGMDHGHVSFSMPRHPVEHSAGPT